MMFISKNVPLMVYNTPYLNKLVKYSITDNVCYIYNDCVSFSRNQLRNIILVLEKLIKQT